MHNLHKRLQKMLLTGNDEMEQEINIEAEQRGYLDRDFHFFNLQDTQTMKFEPHFHDFCKIVLFLSGNVTYFIEGTGYTLKPGDILLINQFAIHKTVIEGNVPYKRMIMWFRPEYLDKFQEPDCNLLQCFALASRHKCNLLRLSFPLQQKIQGLFGQLADTCEKRDFGDAVLCTSLLLQILVYLNRAAEQLPASVTYIDREYDEMIDRVIAHIDANLTEELTIEKLASRFYLSKYYLMRKFKYYTGYSIHRYVLYKRLLAAHQLLKRGAPVMNACLESGFHDYANFARAFKKMYGYSPKQCQV